jgi:hypothetical protein
MLNNKRTGSFYNGTPPWFIPPQPQNEQVCHDTTHCQREHIDPERQNVACNGIDNEENIAEEDEYTVVDAGTEERENNEKAGQTESDGIGGRRGERMGWEGELWNTIFRDMDREERLVTFW